MSENRIERAFASVDRADFLRAASRPNVAYDGPLPIGRGQTNSQPSTVRDMLELLDVRSGQNVLDVGSGSGWTTALLGELAGPQGRVRGVELDAELVEWGRSNVDRYEMPWVSIRQATAGELGLPKFAPFDRILVSAMASKLPSELVSQLDDTGIMVIPVSGVMTRIVRRGPDLADLAVTEHGYYRFVPLR